MVPGRVVEEPKLSGSKRSALLVVVARHGRMRSYFAEFADVVGLLINR